ncbi:MAG: 1,4-alpha-glucan branching enzyme, partial [Clostridia bacterium]
MKKLVQKGVKSSPEKLFHEGKNYRAYDYLGAHFKDDSVTFRAWAPNAKAVSVVGDFNGWDVSANKMKNISNSGIWETSISSLKQYDNYKFAITAKDGHVIMKADPFAFHAETRPGTASKLYDMSGYKWGDTRWSQYNGRYNINERPMNIYEVHIGSWRKNEDGSFYSYCQLADTLVPYVKQ